MRLWNAKKALIVGVASLTVAAHADTIAYWQMQDGAAGKAAEANTVIRTEVNAPALNAKVGKSKSATIRFSSDVPGKVIVSGKDGKVVNKNNTASVKVTGKASSVPTLSVAGNKLLNQESFTIEAFVKLSEVPKWTRILCKQRAKNHFSWILSCEDASGNLRGRVDSNPFDAKNKTGFNQGMPTKKLIVDGKWHHIAATYDGKTKKFYIYMDYEVKSRATIPLPMIYDGDRMCFLYSTFPGDIWAEIDEVRFSNNVLLPEQFLRVKR